MKIKTFFILFSIFSILFVFSFTYISFQKYQQTIVSETQKESIIVTQNVKSQIEYFIDEITYKYDSKQEENVKIYYEALSKIENNSSISIKDLKKEYELKYTDRKIDFYMISEDMIIDNTTYSTDLGLDFKKLPDAYEVLKKVYISKKLDISAPFYHYYNKNFIQYFVKRVKGKNILFQMSVVFDDITKKFYSKIKDKTPSLQSISIYRIYSEKSKDAIKIENVLRNNFINKKEDYSKREKKEEFRDIYEKLLHKKIPDSSDVINKILQKNLRENKGQLSCIENFDNKVIQTVLVPLITYEKFQQQFVIAQYLTMKFDISDLNKNIKTLKTESLMFNLVYFLIVLVLIYILYKKILEPLYILNSSMENSSTISNRDFLAKNNEISNMMNTYNNLFNNLNNEIDKNQFLLNENKQFIADTVHQIRTPLTNIMMNGDMIKLYKKDEKLLTFIDQINASINILNNSYEDLSYITTYDTLEYESSSICLSDVLKNRVKFFETISKVNKKEIDLQIDTKFDFTINQIECERLIDNNISNAIKYAQIEKPISISLTTYNDKVILTFKTYGNPIQNTSKLFEKNYRENNGKRGLGLGLYMVKNICNKYNISYNVTYEDAKNIFIYVFK